MFRFSSYYGDHMVLQKAPAKAVVWGFGQTGAVVVVSLSEPHKVSASSALVVNGKNQLHDSYHFKPVWLTFLCERIQNSDSVFNVSGIWRTTLNPVEAGGPYNLTAFQNTTKSSITLTDVLFGDIWICSGQSNMAFTVSQVSKFLLTLKVDIFQMCS